MKSPLILLILALPAGAIETRWTATGSVTSVTGAGLAAEVDTPVSVKFSYDSGATKNVINNNFIQVLTAYYGPVQLKMEVAIGDSKWTVDLPTSPTDVFRTDARPNATDLFWVTGSTTNGATFPSFPYAGTPANRSVYVELSDNHRPSKLLVADTFPDDSCDASSISSGLGKITADGAVINFSIDPASVTVETGTPVRVTLEKIANGVRLRWPTEAGVLYLLNESDDCQDWQFSNSYTGDGQDQVVEFPDAFTDHPARRFYQVVRD